MEGLVDTTAITLESFLHPNVRLLEANGGKVFRGIGSEKPYKIIRNSQEGKIEPSITVTRFRQTWFTKAEVAVGQWIHDSRLRLASLADVPEFYRRLSEFVESVTGQSFKASEGRVTRLDIASDLRLDPIQIHHYLDSRRNLTMAKYDRNFINGSTIAFDNKGKKKNKRYHLYDRQKKLRTEKAPAEIVDEAAGTIRVEVQHKDNESVRVLALSLDLPNHNARTILTQETANHVISKAIKYFHVELNGNDQKNLEEKLFTLYSSATSRNLITHLHLESQFGTEYYLNSLFKQTKAQVNRSRRLCRAAGVYSLSNTTR